MKSSVVIVVADGARPDTLGAAMDAGHLPALARLRQEGGTHDVTSVFPSVTGPAYSPFLMGRYPGPVGLPGLRWYDRSRKVCRMPWHARSYVGPEMRQIDSDIALEAPTIFELVPSRLAALNVIGRGAESSELLARSAAFAIRAGLTHFRGNVRGWLDIDRQIASDVTRELARRRPAFTFVALTGIDKTSHAAGQASALALEAMRIVDSTIARIRADAERDSVWGGMTLMVVSDHGHSDLSAHEDLDRVIAGWGFRVLSHPWVFTRSPDVAVMVSGNAMAHLYLEPRRRERPFWPGLSGSWSTFADRVMSLDSVDLAILPTSANSCTVRSAAGSACLSWSSGRFSYALESGDPLGTGEFVDLDERESYDLTLGGTYPDAPVQIASIVSSARSGDIIISATPGWDFRARYEPIPHVSSHGALRSEHMLVPLLLNRAPSTPPRRTVDIMPSALSALGITIPEGLDGVSFY